MEGTYDEIDIDEHKPLKLEFALASPLNIQGNRVSIYFVF